MTRLLHFVAVSGLLLSSVGCCCFGGGGGYGACYPPAPAGPCPGGACGVGAAVGPGIAQQTFYNSYSASQSAVVPTATAPVALGPIIPGPVAYTVPTTTTTFITTPTTTAALQPLPTY